MGKCLAADLGSILLITSAAWSQEGVGTIPAATLFLSGDPAPDGNGIFDSPGIPVINAAGQVALVVGLLNTQNPPADVSGIYLVDVEGARKLVRGGEPAPGGNGVFNYFAYDFNEVERVAVNDSGDVAFTANLIDTAGGSTDNSGLFGANAMGGVTEYVRISDPAPDGNGNFGPLGGGIDPAFSAPGLDNSGQISFHGTLTGTSGGEMVDDRGVFRSDGGSPTKVLRVGQAEPSGPSTIEGIDSNSHDRVVFSLNLFRAVPPAGERSSGIYRWDGSDIVLLLHEGDPAPDGNGAFGDVAVPVFLNEGGQIAFSAFLSDGRQGLFLWGAENIFGDGFEGGDFAGWDGVSP
jgi:hypothetical protein